ncbi:hypothetical protein HYDPIDRAFT_111462 [Hydnomerulius pinastri MD-312]|uniref:VWFA domain-containing protein n=1 Tax=Hydnomerulius pinastri MD-312 TaxID=994086 RepID=A0A0C9VGW1_9AGAM|nr:hypothetical protein HYDPIDRAFT_111462 [Hydnomerulius pinastri MD-312]
MDHSFRPPDLFTDDSDDEDIYVPSKKDKGKQKAEDPYLNNFGGDWPTANRGVGSTGYTPSYSVHSDSISVDLDSSPGGPFSDDDDSQSTASLRVLPHQVRPRAESTESDSDESFYESVDVNNPPESLSDEQMDVDMSPPSHDDTDLAYSIRGMYRVLDLITEQGSGGLVDKIIISQNSLEAFINAVCPGAYASMTKVNFKALDNFIIKPVGVYGSKEEIVRFLSELGVVDDHIAAQLLLDTDTSGPAKSTLRSGLYIIRTTEQSGNTKQVFLLYWPEAGTWDDSAASSVRRNRITFMRYLTKMCDQVVALISSEHAQTIVWSEQDEDVDDLLGADQDESDRMFTFEVAQTNEQEESVSVREGFKAVSDRISLPEVLQDGSVDPASIKPFLLFGETVQGFMTVKHQAARRVADPFKARTFSTLQLEGHLKSDCLLLSESLDDEAVKILVRVGLEKRFPQECGQWKHDSIAVHAMSGSGADAETKSTKIKLQREYPHLARSLHEAVLDEVQRLYPCLDRLSFPYPANAGERTTDSPEPLATVVSLYPKVGEHVYQQLQSASLSVIADKEFKTAKERICIVKQLLPRSKQLDKQKRKQLLNAAFAGELSQVKDALQAIATRARSTGTKQKTSFIPSSWKISSAWNWLTSSDTDADVVDRIIKEANQAVLHTTDSQFLTDLEHDVQRLPGVKDLAADAQRRAYEYLEPHIARLVKKLVPAVQKIQEDECNMRIKREHASREEQEQRRLRVNLIRRLNELSKQTPHSHTLRINAAEESKGSRYYGMSWSSATSYQITGSRESQEDPMVIYTVHLMNLTTQDQQALQLDPNAVPSPRFKFAHSFRLPQGHSVIRAQLLEGEKLLLVVADRSGNLTVYLEGLAGMDGAIERGRGKALNREKIGQDFILAFDESKRMLGVVSSDKLLLHIFVFDDSRGFQALGSSINLVAWYGEGFSIRHACFVSGSEELLLVDSQAQARIFSLVTLQFRPATLNLEQIPFSVYSTPDGSCLLVAQIRGSETSITAYHWSTFGSTEGIALDIPNLPVGDALLATSLISRTSVHLVTLDFSAHACQSYVLDITRKVTEFMFRERGVRGPSLRNTNTTAHNCLIDCHSEVWTRFPVLSAVQRETISSSSLRSPKTLVFVSDRDFPMFAPHFADMIHTFERTTKKPTGDVLKSIRVSAASFVVFSKELCGNTSWNVSQYRAGEWIVDILCLIPIHIAITKENRFIPLKDGVYSPDLEKSLLGADVNRIVDSLSFGWYESLFQSYMASKPVKVVSSMGEQSVGKSFALNHLVDTSFAGSAMRTTEGVWMSVTPTQQALIVALDFEGVHSIERSAQEDTLLVLFNTAISNLVLFRNNFALSRDITGLFQSFQSSSTVLDPAANPSLFQSTLVIIIKDVVDSDKVEIAKEFSLKFQRIVQDEQEANFISRLHAGKLNIIPWPVIESKEFYKLFPAVKRRLDQQVITHRAAGEFLHMMKTLMAKLKANDWGAMSQTMASHRAQLISTLLPNALAFGFAEIDPDREPLKNMDTDLPVDLPDTTYQLFFAAGGTEHSASRERTLSVLRSAWDQHDSRQHVPDPEWIEGLSTHLETIVNLRIDHVREWLTQNLTRFQAGHASIEELRRTFEGAIVDLKSNVQLCKIQCAECQLLCVQSRLHDGPHHCQTDHLCAHECDFCLELSGEHKACNMSAGHAGKHICVVTEHLCGKPCKFQGRHGCLDACTKVTDHPEDEHLCAAPVHACGKPCDLSGVKLVDGSTYACPGSCRIPSDIDHLRHECDARLCSIPCQLCKRLCSDQDHMHGLDSGAVHLCGQEHLCAAVCSAPGICEIETAPQSIEATFTGRNETFQYTKVLAKRLKCIKPIPPGATKHKGSHNHSLDKKVVHFCEMRCENCGYFCTLPLGHPQQEHETRHGSMSRTRWTVDGPDDVPLEIEGRKFSTNDEGAPMMCNLVCQTMGRHVHIDYCRADDEAACTGNEEIQHLTKLLQPNPDRPKDALTHSLFWKRSGFKDPYSKEEQANFAKCDAMCSGPEHTAAGGNPAIPSYCTLPLFHPPQDPNTAPGMGYISHDGHQFSCRNPVVMQQAFHVIFVADHSGSMWSSDRKPLANTPASARISAQSDNRFGAVLSSLFSFWTARAAAVASSHAARRDAYSVILFNHDIETPIINDFASTPDELLDTLLPFDADGGTNFTSAIRQAQAVMEQSWSTERSPVVIFLSDGECSIADQIMQDFCRAGVRLGKAVSFHSVSFGPDAESTYLRRMTEIALDAQRNAPRDPLAPAAATVLSSYTQALDTIQLAETFLGIAESLRKPRGALMH